LQTSIREINQALQHVDMALMEGATDVTGDVYYVLVQQRMRRRGNNRPGRTRADTMLDGERR